MSARIVEVIEVETVRGNGRETPIRTVMQYWSREGQLLAERDHAVELAARNVTRDATHDADEWQTFRMLVKEATNQSVPKYQESVT